MYLTVHAVAGALVGSYIDQPLISFIVGFISHFFLDMLPHYDAHLPKGKKVRELKNLYFRKIIGLIYFDISLTVIVAAILFTNNIHFLNQSIIFGVVGSVLPDVLQAISYFKYKNIFFKKFNELHRLLHYSPESEISIFLGHVTQLITLVILIRPLI